MRIPKTLSRFGLCESLCGLVDCISHLREKCSLKVIGASVEAEAYEVYEDLIPFCKVTFIVEVFYMRRLSSEREGPEASSHS
jgi:hypothetical protein